MATGASGDGGRQLGLVAAAFLDAGSHRLPAAHDPLGEEPGAAREARLAHGTLPDREGARRIVRARVEGLAATAPPLDELPAASLLRADDAQGQRLRKSSGCRAPGRRGSPGCKTIRADRPASALEAETTTLSSHCPRYGCPATLID